MMISACGRVRLSRLLAPRGVMTAETDVLKRRFPPVTRFMSCGEADESLERIAAGFAHPQMPDAAAVAVFRPFGNEDALATLGAFDHRTRAREFSSVAVQFHWASFQILGSPAPTSLLINKSNVIDATLKQQG
jgi:hypothetical protein